MSDIVAKQYTQWCYPQPIPDMAKAIKETGYYEFTDPRLFWPLLWPEGRQGKPPLRVLIAGCGTNQAAYNALSNPSAQVTAIDLSLTSLQHTQYLKEKHGLDNLTLHHLNLLEVDTLDQQFDLIISTGVLHHLPDPEAGLCALGSDEPDALWLLPPCGCLHDAGSVSPARVRATSGRR
ncbi:class I SAM-dependent methyltransferase [Halomonas vilamensis]|uniref:Class I SAM-dependent methyltransferase n=1 Tax=Vreelandella vilamensis TaxID=531309 RepID=A0ABU1H832_9GAMM|nr:class I SAM-dependent methyltransferase [Halomonas vilamensis]MDR5900464.1 class I SAM-dependent methyltransferase [Halomonas vilamensis]